MYRELLVEVANRIYTNDRISENGYNSLIDVIKEMNEFEAYMYIEEKKNWIQGAVKKPGSLHRALGVPQGKKIPKKLLKVKSTDTPKMKKRKILAQTFSKMKKG